MSKLTNWVNESEERQKAVAQEYLICAVAEDIWAKMQDVRCTEQQLALKLGRSESEIHNMLDGSTDITLRTLADIASVLNCQIDVIFNDK